MNIAPANSLTSGSAVYDPATMTPQELAQYNDILDIVEETFGVLVLSLASSQSNPTGWTGWDWRENDQR